MRSPARIVVTFSLVMSAALAGACQPEGDRQDQMASATDGSAPASPPAPPSGDASAGNKVDFAGRREVAAERARLGQVAGTAGAVAPDRAPGTDPLQGIGQFNAGGTSMMIRTGQAFIEVEQLDPAVLKVRQLAVQVGGFIANSSIIGGREQIRQATFEIKIPAPKYDEAVGSLSQIGKVETVSSSAQDVGEEFVDITARVTNARRLEERLISLLANRTGKLDEVLRVERELARVREEIERYEGRMRYLSARVAMSTLTLTIHEPGPLLGNNPGDNPIGAAVRRAWRNFVGLIAGLIASLGILIPLGALAALAWIGYRRWRKDATRENSRGN
ncbi:MAG TPA: DUF4349 domain-containing protein [Gemmatimonadaceae bacterium]|nr:DUF4349 domain-containing protein [Gemmatimonadaceae bacterium]